MSEGWYRQRDGIFVNKQEGTTVHPLTEPVNITYKVDMSHPVPTSVVYLQSRGKEVRQSCLNGSLHTVDVYRVGV